MPRSIRRPLTVLCVLGLAVATLGLTTGAAADCGGPTISVAPAVGPPGTAFTVTGQGFATQCNDVNPPPGPHGVGGPPATDIEISITDSGLTRTALATVDAGFGYGFTVTVSVPDDAALGVASVQATMVQDIYVAPAEFTVTGEVIPATPVFTG